MTVLAAILAAGSTFAHASMVEYVDCELGVESPNNGMNTFLIYAEDLDMSNATQPRPALMLTRADGTNIAISGTISGSVATDKSGEIATFTYGLGAQKEEIHFSGYSAENGIIRVVANYQDPDLNQSVPVSFQSRKIFECSTPRFNDGAYFVQK